jgi:hypothetical protein
MKKMLATLLLIPTIANAEFFSGNELLTYMNGTTVEKSVALGYIIGVSDTLTNATICPPSTITAGQVKDIIKTYIEENPAIRHFTADSIVRSRLEELWACRKGKNA